MPGSDIALLPPPPPSTLHCQPLRQTRARCETRVHAIHAGPHPFPALARDPAGGEGRSISCREFAAGFSSLLQLSSAWRRGAQSPAAEPTEERELRYTHALPGGADPGDTLGRGRERGRPGPEWRWGSPAAGGGRTSHQPSVCSSAFSPRRHHLAQVGTSSFPWLLCVGERAEVRGRRLVSGRGWQISLTPDIPYCSQFRLANPVIGFVLPVTLFRRLEGRGNADGPQERLESDKDREAGLESRSPSGPGAGRAVGRRRRRGRRRDALCLAGPPEGHRAKDTRPPAPRAPRPKRRQSPSPAG